MKYWNKLTGKIMIAVMIILSFLVVPPAVTKAAAAPALTKTSRNILIGAEYDLNIRNKIAKSQYTWSSSNKKIATVDNWGIVKGVAKGSAVITCKIKTQAKTYKLTCKVTIIKPASAIRINNKITELKLGEEYDVNRTLTPSSSNDKTTWTSSDPSIAAPDKNGKFTALKTGTVTITGKTLSGKKDSMTFTVVEEESGQPEATPAPDPGAAGGIGGGAGGGVGGGGAVTPTPGVTETVNSDGSISYKLSRPYTDLSAVSVSYKGETFSADGPTLSLFKLFLADDALAISQWKAFDDEEFSVGGQSLAITGTAGSGTKTVTFGDGQLDGRSYEISVGSNSSVTVRNPLTDTAFTLTRVDDYTLKISANHSDVTFNPAFN